MEQTTINLLLMLATGILYIEVSGRIIDKIAARNPEPVNDWAKVVLFFIWPLLFLFACFKALYNATR